MKKTFETKFALLSIVFAIIHFTGETVWHFQFGQFLPMLIVDYIAVSLLLFGGIRTLRTNKAIGLLCGAWGFEFCLNYRALFNRVEKLMLGQGIGDPAVDVTAYILAGLLLISLTAFATALYLTNPRQNSD